MKYLYYLTYVLKEIGLAGALFCAGFCLLLNLQFVSGVEVSGRLLVALGLGGVLKDHSFRICPAQSRRGGKGA